jgi:aspartate racemase
MKMIGLIGGMSWESTALYYHHLNRMVRDRLGGLHSAKLMLWSFDFAVIAARQQAGDWDGAALLLVDAARRLEQAGAEALVICAKTMHRVALEVQTAVSIPLLHIADATGEAIQRTPSRRPALLATRFTMEQDFYRAHLRDRYGLEPMIPDAPARDLVHRVIFDELCQGVVRPESKSAYLAVIDDLRRDGADGVILGCTEIGLLIGQQDTALPLFDTTQIHAAYIMDFACGGSFTDRIRSQPPRGQRK